MALTPLSRSSCLSFRLQPAGRCASSLNLRIWLHALRVAAASAPEPAFVAESPMYDSAKGQTTVTSQVSGIPSLQGTIVSPSGRLPSALLLLGLLLLLLLLMLLSTRCAYRARRAEARIQQMLWKVNYADIVFMNAVYTASAIEIDRVSSSDSGPIG